MTDLKLKALQETADRNNYLFGEVDPGLLEAFPAPGGPGEVSDVSSQAIHIEIPEFTSLCPLTGQPDFATIVIDYIPSEKCVESKSIKMYVAGYRNHGEFHEACVARFTKDLVTLLDPKWLRVTGLFTPRGGIPFQPSRVYIKGGYEAAVQRIFAARPAWI